MKDLLQQAKKLYPKDTLFFSASGLIKSPLRVTGLKLSEVYKNTIINSDGGILYDNDTQTWAKRV